MTHPKSDNLIEEPFFFEHEGSQLLAVLHRPPKSASLGDARGVVFCDAFENEAAVSQKVCAEFARVLARRGYHVLRFNYRGCGDSEGRFDDTTPSIWMADIRAAVGQLRGRTGGGAVGLFGLRLGATWAAMVAAAEPSIESLVLWEPITDTNAYLRNFIRMQVMATNLLAGKIAETREQLIGRLEKRESADILGYSISPECFDQFAHADVLSQLEGWRGPTLIAGLSRTQRLRRDLRAMADVYESHGCPAELIAVQEKPFWVDPDNAWRELRFWHGHDDLFAQTADWLDRTRPKNTT